MERPTVHAIVAKVHAHGFVTDTDHVTLEEAAQMAEQGFDVIVDFADLEQLTRWEQMQRARGLT